jgi:hypothetical protein
MREEDELAAIEQWFEGLGYGVMYTKNLWGQTWANLTRFRDGVLFAPKYGRGKARIEAARSAKHRYETEQ